MDYIALKIEFLNWTGAPQDLMHVFGGVLIQIVAAGLTMRSLASLIPLCGVLLLELLNEWFDVQHLGGWDELSEGQVFGVYWDIAITMALPLLLFCLARFWPGLLVGRERIDSSDQPQPE